MTNNKTDGICVLDICCGTGTIGICAAMKAQKLLNPQSSASSLDYVCNSDDIQNSGIKSIGNCSNSGSGGGSGSGSSSGSNSSKSPMHSASSASSSSALPAPLSAQVVVIGVELCAAAVENALLNAQLNGLRPSCELQTQAQAQTQSPSQPQVSSEMKGEEKMDDFTESGANFAVSGHVWKQVKEEEAAPQHGDVDVDRKGYSTAATTVVLDQEQTQTQAQYRGLNQEQLSCAEFVCARAEDVLGDRLSTSGYGSASASVHGEQAQRSHGRGLTTFRLRQLAKGKKLLAVVDPPREVSEWL